MRREIRIVIAAFAAGVIAVGAERGVRMAEAWGWFSVAEVDFVGLERISRRDALAAMGMDHGSSMLIPPAEWSSRLESHPLVHTASVRLRFPRRLSVTLTEREPVALVPTPVLVPTDSQGWVLPINPTERRLDLPIVNLEPPVHNRFTMAVELATLAEMGRLTADHPSFVSMVSEVVPLGYNGIAAHLSDPPVVFLMLHGTPSSRIDEGIRAIRDAVESSQGTEAAAVDLRFADQVVIRPATDTFESLTTVALISDEVDDGAAESVMPGAPEPTVGEQGPDEADSDAWNGECSP